MGHMHARKLGTQSTKPPKTKLKIYPPSAPAPGELQDENKDDANMMDEDG